MQKQHILAISGSLRPGSSNHAILDFFKSVCPGEISCTYYNDLDKLPHFNPGLDNEHPPAKVIELRELLSRTDAVIICSPEYAYGIPGSLKNALDWLVSSGSFSGKPTGLVTASTGGETAHAALLKVLGAINAHVDKGASLLVPFIRSKMDSEGNITDSGTEEKLRGVFSALVGSIA